MSSKKILSIASDHGGFALKSAILKDLSGEYCEFIDRGPETSESVDYPDFAKLVCDDVNSGRASLGVLICTSGIGMSIAANKIRGIRAALCLSEDAAKFSRLHNNTNIICMGQKRQRRLLGGKISDAHSRGVDSEDIFLH